MYFESRSVASWVTRSQLIGCGGGASETPRDAAGQEQVGSGRGGEGGDGQREAGEETCGGGRDRAGAAVEDFDHALKEHGQGRGVNWSIGLSDAVKAPAASLSGGVEWIARTSAVRSDARLRRRRRRRRSGMFSRRSRTLLRLLRRTTVPEWSNWYFASVKAMRRFFTLGRSYSRDRPKPNMSRRIVRLVGVSDTISWPAIFQSQK